MLSQQKQIELHLLKRGSITSWEAIDLYGITRLSALIYNLKYKKGYFDRIKSERVYTRKWWRLWKKTRFVRYTLTEGEENGK